MMIEILGTKYITEKEAVNRFKYSASWFQKARYDQSSPPYVKFNGKGRVYYPLETLDNWFMQKMQVNY